MWFYFWKIWSFKFWIAYPLTWYILVCCWTVYYWGLKIKIVCMSSFIASDSFILPPFFFNFMLTESAHRFFSFHEGYKYGPGTTRLFHSDIKLCFRNESLGKQRMIWVTLISACSASNGTNRSLLWWLSHPLFPVGVWKLRIPIAISHWGYSLWQVQYRSTKMVRAITDWF